MVYPTGSIVIRRIFPIRMIGCHDHLLVELGRELGQLTTWIVTRVRARAGLLGTPPSRGVCLFHLADMPLGIFHLVNLV